MFKVQYRNIFDPFLEEYGRWFDWSELGEFETVDTAMDEVLREAYTNVPDANINNFHVVDLGAKFAIYEVGVQPRDWQFRFIYEFKKLPIDSPWKIGLNDVQSPIS